MLLAVSCSLDGRGGRTKEATIRSTRPSIPCCREEVAGDLNDLDGQSPPLTLLGALEAETSRAGQPLCFNPDRRRGIAQLRQTARRSAPPPRCLLELVRAPGRRGLQDDHSTASVRSILSLLSFCTECSVLFQGPCRARLSAVQAPCTPAPWHIDGCTKEQSSKARWGVLAAPALSLLFQRGANNIRDYGATVGCVRSILPVNLDALPQALTHSGPALGAATQAARDPPQGSSEVSCQPCWPDDSHCWALFALGSSHFILPPFPLKWRQREKKLGPWLGGSAFISSQSSKLETAAGPTACRAGAGPWRLAALSIEWGVRAGLVGA